MARMGKAATPEAIARAEAALGIELPDDVRASYAIHDGSGGWNVFPFGDYLSLEKMVNDYESWNRSSMRFADALSEVGIELSDSGHLYWYWEDGMARSEFPTSSQQATMQERERSLKYSKRYFERSAGTPKRFWEVTHDKAEVTTRYGKVGTEGRSTTRTCDNTASANIEAGKAVAKKVRDGYVEKT